MAQFKSFVWFIVIAWFCVTCVVALIATLIQENRALRKELRRLRAAQGVKPIKRSLK